jgi:hypothetical protein
VPTGLASSGGRILVPVADDRGEHGATGRTRGPLISTTVPSAARVVDYLYGGQTNFESDRRAARALAAVAPVVADLAPAVRAFKRRLLRFLVTEAGIRQFLDIGTGLPRGVITHEIAQSLAPECRVVYTDDDPMVLAHARALMRSAPRGAVGHVDADVLDPASILAGARSILDFDVPIAVLLLFTLAFVRDGAAATAVISSLMSAAQPGSYVAIYQMASDIDPEMEEAARQWNKMMPTEPIGLRSGPDVSALTEGLDPVPPGLVPVTEWRPDPADPRFGRAIPVHAIVARKP